MPIYEFRCECGYETEVLTSLHALAPFHCNKSMGKLISRPGHFIFKGTGFYATEYGNQPDNLSVKDQGIRAKREIKNAGMRIPVIPSVH